MDTVMIRSGKVVSLLGKPITSSHGTITGYNGVTTTSTGDAHYKDSPYSTFQATVTGTGAVTATVVIDCSMTAPTGVLLFLVQLHCRVLPVQQMALLLLPLGNIFEHE